MKIIFNIYFRIQIQIRYYIEKSICHLYEIPIQYVHNEFGTQGKIRRITPHLRKRLCIEQIVIVFDLKNVGATLNFNKKRLSDLVTLARHFTFL
jgi:hypothetical protein